MQLTHALAGSWPDQAPHPSFHTRDQGELAATAVNAPMVSAEVLAELQPYVALAQGLGTAAVQLVGSHGYADVYITYASPRGGARPPDCRAPSMPSPLGLLFKAYLVQCLA